MSDPVTDGVAQKDLHGAVATIARAEGCHVIPLHQNATNPKNQSDPDFLLLKPGMRHTFVKCLLKPDSFTSNQQKVRSLIEDDETSVYFIIAPTQLAALVEYLRKDRS